MIRDEVVAFRRGRLTVREVCCGSPGSHGPGSVAPAFFPRLRALAERDNHVLTRVSTAEGVVLVRHAYVALCGRGHVCPALKVAGVPVVVKPLSRHRGVWSRVADGRNVGTGGKPISQRQLEVYPFLHAEALAGENLPAPAYEQLLRRRRARARLRRRAAR